MKKLLVVLLAMCLVFSVNAFAAGEEVKTYNLDVAKIDNAVGDPNFKIYVPRADVDEMLKLENNTVLQLKQKNGDPHAYGGLVYTGPFGDAVVKSSFETNLSVDTLGDKARGVMVSLRREAITITPQDGEPGIILVFKEKGIGITNKSLDHQWLPEEVAGVNFGGTGGKLKIVDDIAAKKISIYCNETLVAEVLINGKEVTLQDKTKATNKVTKTYGQDIANSGTYAMVAQACTPKFSNVKVTTETAPVEQVTAIRNVLDQNRNKLTAENLSATQNVILVLDNPKSITKAQFVVAYYDDNGRLVKIKMKNAQIPENNEVVLENPNTDKGTLVRFFMMNSNLSPLAKPYTITKNTGLTDSINYAEELKNGVVLRYENPERKAVVFENKNASVTYKTIDESNKQVAKLANKNGVPYVENTMDVVMVDQSNNKYYGKTSDINARLNAYKMGLYYYDIHMLELIPKKEGAAPGATVNGTVVMSSSVVGNPACVENIEYENEKLSFKIKDSSDPYIMFPTQNISVEASPFIQLTMKYEKAAGAASTSSPTFRFYYGTDSNPGIGETKAKSGPITADGTYHTYLLDMSSSEWKGTVKDLRMDIDAGDFGATVEIDKIEIVSFGDSIMPAKIENIFNVYSDKIHWESYFIATNDFDFKEAYTETAIDASRVNALAIKDINGLTASVDNYDANTVEYVAFNVDNAGVFGYIYPSGGESGKVTVTLENGQYIVRNYAKETGVVKKDKKVKILARIFTDETDSFASIQKEASVERRPLNANEFKLINPASYNKFEGYNRAKGFYRVTTYGMGMTEAFHTKPNEIPAVSFAINNNDLDREIYVQTYSSAGALAAGAVQTLDNTLLPIPVEVSKNFQGENEEPFYDPGDASYSESLFPLRIKKFQSVELSSLHLYQNFGKYPLKQISGIRFFNPYYHISTGVTETNCWVPFYLSNGGWILTDLRTRSGQMWAGQPQFNSVGIDKIFEYITPEGKLVRGENTGAAIDNAGTAYSDLTFTFKTYDDKVKVTERSVEFPQTDENRTFIELDLEFLEDLTINDAKKEFALFYTYANFAKYRKLSYIDASNQHKTVDIVANAKEVYPIGKESGYFTLHDYPTPTYGMSERTQDGANLGIMVRDFEMILNGQPSDIGTAVYNSVNAFGTTETKLTLNTDSITFKKGDRIKACLLVLPWGTINQSEDTNMQAVRQTDGINRLYATASKGTVIQDAFIPTVKLANEEAEFTVTGGKNNVVFRVEGSENYEKPTVEYYEGSTWKTLDNSFDNMGGYNVYVDKDGKFGFSFVFETDGTAKQFRVSR